MNKSVIWRLSFIVLLLIVTATIVLLVRAGHWQSTATATQAVSNRMVFLKGGSFLMGTASTSTPLSVNHPHRANKSTEPVEDPGQSIGGEDEHPAHQVTLNSFYLDAYEVTNSEFATFIEATGYQTDAEKKGFSWVFKEGFKDFEAIEAADWRHPLGPDSTITNLMNHPVVHVSWNDAMVFAKWAGKRLPTEAEWEYAARNGRRGQLYPWGNQLMPQGKPLANFWQGTWPEANTLEDTFYYSSPVGSFPPNSFGLYDMIGNVWEWTADWYAADYYSSSPGTDPKGPATGEMRVARGGSWFCAVNYCGAYRVGFRGKTPPDDSFNNLGFRCAKDAQGN